MVLKKELLYISGMTCNHCQQTIGKEHKVETEDTIDKYREELENGKCFLQPITSGESYGSPCEIKRRLKYCKNPMERMKLQRELNSAYKHYGGHW